MRIETLLLQDAMPLEADGNVRGVTPVQFQVMPGVLQVCYLTETHNRHKDTKNSYCKTLCLSCPWWLSSFPSPRSSRDVDGVVLRR